MSGDIPVREVIHDNILQCAPDHTLREVARRMAERRCSSILVVADGEAVGIWTERDALKVDFTDSRVVDRPIADFMSTPVKTIPGDILVNDVAIRFKEDAVRHYLVVDGDGASLGIISLTDVVLNQSIEHYLHLRNVGTVVQREPPRIPPDSGLDAAADAIRRHGIDAVVVMESDGGNPGILTERDLVRHLATGTNGVTAGDLASRPLLTVRHDRSLFHVRNVMVEEGVRHIGVVNAEDDLQGLVGFADILTSVEFVYVRELKTALKERDTALETSRVNLRLAEKVIEASPDGVVITDTSAVIQSVNPAFTRLTGYQPEEAIGNTPGMLSSGRHGPEFYRAMWRALEQRGQWQGEIWNRRKNGELYPELLTITAIRDDHGNLTNYAAIFSDITKLKENEERVRRLAYYDALTDLPNRRLFEDRLEVALAQAHRYDHILALLYVDLDRFKRINDTLGHDVGDRLLQRVTASMNSVLSEGDTLARVGGDEFVILLPELDETLDAVRVARRLVEVLGEPFHVDEHELFVTSSIGVSFYPMDGTDGEMLLHHADYAMYRAKEVGRNNYQLYTAEMNARSFQSLNMEAQLRHALGRGEMACHYQPVVDAQTGATVGAEALLRWHHPEMGPVAPADFIPLAEESGLIIDIGDWVVRSVCAQLRAWRDAGLATVPVGINFSALQFRRTRPHAVLASAMDEFGIGAEELVLELTESVIMSDISEAVGRLRGMRDLGIGLAIDDFGTGYSSLAYLRRFPITALKVDQSFVRALPSSEEDTAIIETVVGLGKSLGITVIAEGVEEPEQRDILRNMGCHRLQGFLYSRAVPAAEFAERFLG
ncbi:MAG: EAL domain-containing protein [Thiohalospira sp.]